MGWYVAKVHCIHCGDDHISVFPEEAYGIVQECPRCSIVACNPTAIYGADGIVDTDIAYYPSEDNHG